MLKVYNNIISLSNKTTAAFQKCFVKEDLGISLSPYKLAYA